VAENARPPVAIRIVRPYDSEEAFLESELETVGKTSVILIGAHPRPQGVILRFEVTLQSGQVILRGEGRVLQHKESAFRGQAGLALRFTRLDPKSKALVDRAAAIRDARLSGSLPPPAPPPPESSSSPISIPEPDPTPPPPLSRPAAPAESRPPTKPPVPTEAPPNPLVAMPSFAPMGAPPEIPSHPPTEAPVPPNATLAPDPVLAQLLTGGTPPPPPATDVATSRPAAPLEMPVDLPADEEKTRPGKVPRLLLQDANVHSTATVAAPPMPAMKDAEPPTTPPSATSTIERVADREALLARLRERRASMSDDTRNAILNKQR
jgi:hypothetical protein